MIKRAYDFIDRTGEKYITNQGYPIKIIEYFNNSNCTVQFECGYIRKRISYFNIKNGAVKNHYHPSVYGVGYIGVGKYKTKENKKPTLMYDCWKGVIRRCYNEKERNKNPSYKNTTICEKWKCFQVFGAWYEQNFKYYMQDWELDKDILIKGNKIYSPTTCAFVPTDVNGLFINRKRGRGKYPIGVSFHKRDKMFSATLEATNFSKYFDTIEEAFQAYKTEKEKYIKVVASKWRGQITEPCYEAMYNYKVEITD